MSKNTFTVHQNWDRGDVINALNDFMGGNGVYIPKNAQFSLVGYGPELQFSWTTDECPQDKG